MATRCPACGEANPPRARFCLGCGSPLAAKPAAPSVVRRTVTVVFCDLVGSTALGERVDPESVREIMGRYFAMARDALQSHGGTVEKFIGDAVMAVFGLPTRREDDALRAARASLAIRAGLDELNRDLRRQWGVRLEERIGIHSGEVVADPNARLESLVTGDPVNTAARLQQMAEPGEILVSAESLRLMRDRVVAERVGRLTLKGKRAAVEGLRLVRLASAAEQARIRRTAFVGREIELAQLTGALEEVIAESHCAIRVVVGSPGIGKSRLVSEFADGLGARARVLRGQCLQYGAGITYWPIAEVIRTAAGIGEEDRRGVATRKLEAVVADGSDGRAVASTIAAVVGLRPADPPGPEIARAMRLFLEKAAGPLPAVVVIDDVHWAEPSMLDLLEYLERQAAAALLLVCSARPEFLDTRPTWSEDQRLISLHPLKSGEIRSLAEHLAGDASLPSSLHDRIVTASEGNPLFAEQLLAMLLDRGLVVASDRLREAAATDALPLPATIEALLASRLERLDVSERILVERAAIVGERIRTQLLRSILPRGLRRRLPALIDDLVRAAYLRPAETDDGDELRFSHVLLRDAAYAGISKRERHELHELVGDEMEAAAGERLPEVQEVIGYHLEQAQRYRRELSPKDPVIRPLADRAARHLAAAGRRAFARGDMSAARNLLGRAVGLRAARDPERIALLPSFGKSLIEVGELATARGVLDEAIRLGAETSDEQTVAYARIHRTVLRVWSEESSPDGERERQEVRSAVAAFERANDHRGLAQAWSLLAEVEWNLLRQAEAFAAIQRAVRHAERSGDEWLRVEYLALSGSDPGMAPDLEEAARTCERLLKAAPGSSVVAARALPMLSQVRAAQGDADAARRLYAEGLDHCRELGLQIWEGEMSVFAGWTEILLGDYEAAERLLRSGKQVLERMGDKMHLSFLSAILARALDAQDRADEALEAVKISQAATPVAASATWRGVYARILARRGDPTAATMATEAAEAMRPMGDWYYADALVDLAQVHVRLGNPEPARSALREARRIYRRMGNVSGQRWVRELQARIRDRTPQ